MRTHTKYFRVADITIELNSDYSISEKTFLPKFKLFEVTEPGDDNIIIHHHFHSYDFSQKKDLLQNVIYSNPQWTIYKAQDVWIYKFTPVLPFEPGCPVTAIINKNHTMVNIYTDKITEEQYKNGQYSALTLFNSDQVLFSKLLCDRQGLIIHSNGFNINGKGILLAGKSGSGKSTLSQMIKRYEFEILCDDRMFAIKKDNCFWIHGNWCHGSVPDVSQMSVPLKAIFFLKQSRKNAIDIISDRKIVAQNLIPAMVKPFLIKDDWKTTLATLEDLIQNIKCYFLSFDLSGNICNNIKEIIGNEE
jgi:hypothetical protein